MAFQPNQEYQTVIAGVSHEEDNDGNAEIHLHIGDGSGSLAYKLKWKTEDEETRSLEVLTSLGIDTRRMTSQSYIDGLGAILSGKEVFIRTKAWEMNGRTGVFIKQLSPTPFLSPSKAIASKISRILTSKKAAISPTATPLDLGVSDDDIPF